MDSQLTPYTVSSTTYPLPSAESYAMALVEMARIVQAEMDRAGISTSARTQLQDRLYALIDTLVNLKVCFIEEEEEEGDGENSPGAL